MKYRKRPQWRGILWLMMIGFLLCALPARADKAIDQLITVKQKDGRSITIRRHGDEHFHYTTDAAGYLMMQSEGQYIYARFGNNGLEPSNEKTSFIPFSYIAKAKAKAQNAALTPITTHTPATKSSEQTCLFILVEFLDNSFSISNPKYEFNNMLNKEDYQERNMTGSVRDYYWDNSYQQFAPSFTVVGPVKLSKTMSHYGARSDSSNDANAHYMALDACWAAHDAGVNFADYDANNDGVVDNIFILFAGYSESEGAAEETIWPHASSISGLDNSIIDGKQLNRYGCSSELRGNSGREMAPIGTICHEYGHTLGLADLYDTDYEANGEAMGLSTLSLMASGNHNDQGQCPAGLTAVERAQLGWMELTPLTEEGPYTLPLLDQKQAYISETANKGEFFAFENRSFTSKWDKGIGGRGMLIYHVDKSNNLVGSLAASTRWNKNSVNNYATHPCYRILEAVSSTSGRVTPASFYPGTSNITAFGSGTSPGPFSWGGIPNGLNIDQITETEGVISFQVFFGTDANISGTVTSFSTRSALSNALVYLSPITKSAAQTGALRAAAFDITSPGVLKGRTNSQGSFRFEKIEPGPYRLICQVEGYITHQQEVEAFVGEGLYAIEMHTEEDRGLDALTWCATSDIVSGVGTGGANIRVGALWDSLDMAPYVGSTIASASFGLLSGSATNATVTLSILEDNVTIVQQTFTNEQLKWQGYNQAVFSGNDAPRIKAGASYIVSLLIRDYDSSGYPAGLDGASAINGKGNLFFSDGWASLLDEYNIDGNFSIQMNLKKNVPNVPVQSITLDQTQAAMGVGHQLYLLATLTPSNTTDWEIKWESSDTAVASVSPLGVVTAAAPGSCTITASIGIHRSTCAVTVTESMAATVQSETAQRMAYVTWDPMMNADRWEVRWKAGSFATAVLSQETSSPEILLDSLKAGTQYLLYIDAFLGDTQVDGYEGSFTTSATTSSYPAISIPSSLENGQRIFLEVLNITAAQETTWTLDNQPITPPFLTLTQGTHTLQATIKGQSAEQGDEVIIRKITVK